MRSRPALLIVDDGELDDIVALLNGLGIEFAHLRGAAIPPQIEPPERVLVTTPRRAMLAKDWPRSAPSRIAVVTEDSNTLRAMLRRVGFDLLLRRPVHPVALRLVLIRALYSGPEKRREERLALGTEISFRSGFRRKKALLADISQRGCRLLGEQTLSAGTRINLPLPKELSPMELSLPCKVVRVAAKPGPDGRFEMGLAFENLTKEKLAELRAVLKRLSDSAGIEDGRVFGGKPPARPAPLAPQNAKPAAATARAGAPVAPAEKASASLAARAALSNPVVEVAAPNPSTANRREHPRATFASEVTRLDDEADSVLLGRDLSVGGMRIEYHPNLQVGDVLELALYVSAREEPIVVKGRVLQDAGDGLGLAFEGIDQKTGERLERLVARLPSVESLQDGESAGLGSVVSRVLSGFRREV